MTVLLLYVSCFFFSSRRRHTRYWRDWSSDVCSSDLHGMDKWRAAKEGAKEIYFAVIATSITLAIIFLPIIFLQGFVGRLFREFGIVVAGAVLISALVSLTLTPVLNVKLTRDVHKHGWFYHKTEPFFRWMENGYY